jgi:hypothetical protein
VRTLAGVPEFAAASRGDPTASSAAHADTAGSEATARRLLFDLAGRLGDLDPAEPPAPTEVATPVRMAGPTEVAEAAGMAEPAEAAEGPIVRWDVTTPHATFRLHLWKDRPGWVVSDGAPGAPAVMIALSLADLGDLAAGRLDGMDAFLGGRIRLSGELAFARMLLSTGGPEGRAVG